MTDQIQPITAFFGIFGERDYEDFRPVDLAFGAAQIPCRWCIGEGKPELKCAACKNTRWMWIGI